MHAERYGNGQDLFFGLHGWSGDHRTWLPLVPYLPARATLIAVDLPGYGRSPAPARWTLDGVAREIAAGLIREAHRPMVVAGNCSGGLLALAAATLPEARAAIARLVLIDPFALWPWYFRVFAAPRGGRLAYRAVFANPAGRWAANQAVSRQRAPGTHLTEGFSGVNHEAAWQHLALLRQMPPPEHFRALTLPIDIVHGSRTFGAVRRSVAIWKEIWPHASVTELPGAGHLPIREAPAALAELVFGGAARR